MASPRAIAVLLALLGATSCWSREAPVATFAVDRISPDLALATEFLLNDAITVYFTRPVDPLSVTRDTVTVLDHEGNAVQGRLRVGGLWVTFEPKAPLTASLEDGSFRPGREYRFVIGGFPRVDCVRALDGIRLEEGVCRTFRTAAAGSNPAGLPAPLRPVANAALPFLLVSPEVDATIPIHNARFQIRLSLPVLPTSLTPDAFQVLMVRPSGGIASKPIELQLAEARLIAIDELQACIAELNLGARPVGKDGAVHDLQAGDFVFLKFTQGERSLRDYANRALQMPLSALCWSVVEGSAAVLMQWPLGDEVVLHTPDLGVPGFQLVRGAFQPLLRKEAGNGELGEFRPKEDLRLAVGEPFDRGDGVQVTSRGKAFAFRAFEIPAGVTVTVDATYSSVQILAMGRARIAGRLIIRGQAPAPVPLLGWRGDLSTIQSSAPVTLIAAGGIEIGAVDGDSRIPCVLAPDTGTGIALALVTAGPIAIHAPIPRAILARERNLGRSDLWIESCVSVQVQLTQGLPAGADCTAVGLSAFRPVPFHSYSPVFQSALVDSTSQIDWQSAPAELGRLDQPDSNPARRSAFREVVTAVPLPALAGMFLRLRLQTKVRGGDALPRVPLITLLDR
ncbi:MAG: hypothetical protein EXS02_10790 [Planctomycetes bacterium]|nr:hypothetical protein [Planctomycetota bacterium]